MPGNTSKDEPILCKEDYITMVTGTWQQYNLQPPDLRPIKSPVNLTKSLSLTPHKYAFTDEAASKNVQEPMQNTIPNALLSMFQAGAYIPMSMFLVKNMEFI